MADYCELNSTDFEKSVVKNKFICSTNEEWIWFVDTGITSRMEIEPILQENDFLEIYDIVLFCSEELDGEVDLLDLLEKPQCRIYAFGVKRQLLVKTGSFNRLLENNTNYEFLLRAVENGTVFAISCNADKREIFDPVTMAYVYRKYMRFLKDTGRADEMLSDMMQLSVKHGKKEAFIEGMKVFLRDTEVYERFVEDTAPCLVLAGDDVCAGVLRGFANSLADELAALGQAVITTDNRYGDYDNLSPDKRWIQKYKVIIGFQASVFKEEILQKMNGKKIQFWFDNPIFFSDFFNLNSKDIYILCQDAYYADYMKEYYGFERSIQFPPGGTLIENFPAEKIYDVTFVGSYDALQESAYEGAYEVGFFEYMMGHPDITFEHGLLEYGKILGVEYQKQEIIQELKKLYPVCKDVIDRSRHNVIEKIVSDGIKLHVFGASWEQYHGKGRENLIIHPMLYGKEPYRVWAQSKIGFNIMHGHKAGMTERIANIMLCKTCCLSDETVYLREHFCDGEDIVLFKRTELDAIPQKIRYLLEHDEERERIAAAGYEKALREHTWRKRAEDLLDLVSNSGEAYGK